jgi:hypothetical protein
MALSEDDGPQPSEGLRLMRAFLTLESPARQTVIDVAEQLVRESARERPASPVLGQPSPKLAKGSKNDLRRRFRGD